MKRRDVAAGLGLAMVLAGCGTSRVIKSYSGPPVTRILVFKASRRMYLLGGSGPLAGFDIDLGFAPAGHKTRYGDGKTPVGSYRIDRRNPDSQFHLSLGISYPNRADVARARSLGVDPGGDIFIHGQPNGFLPEKPDWTWGCIAVENHEMEDIYTMVRTGTPISIFEGSA